MVSEVQIGTWKPHRPRGPIAALYSSPGPKYGLPGNTGYTNHDPSKFRAPAFSFGTRRFKYMDDCSPGPEYLVPANMTVRGKEGTPAYSIYGRPKDFSIFQTPGPGSYAPERAGKSAFPSPPRYSLGARTKMFSNDQTPGPAAYKLPSVIGTHVVNRSSAPNYSMTGRSKIGSFHEDLQKTPGPGAYRVVDPTLYKYKPPQYSMTARNSMPGDATQKPGPGAYKPEKVVMTRSQAPSFSFGIRHSPYVAPLIVDVAD
ncbi:outer dense fiber protein 3B [Spea bombifrons]|uniref:outer dense fiber protein 3B n=1 Tax=Spea bombifrons TaxID=233779 RepID=UPI00234B173F|nr:outer dense fiber protein 3B [Spea bombifrons]XP_053320421.1 outer dense fiber protein 3B [Spea bombifrons]XP_053320422.1 outer dense fiber protein 3B [Spea bombifrons]